MNKYAVGRTTSLILNLLLYILASFKTNSNDFKPVIVNEEVLKAMDPTHVFVCKWQPPLRWRWYKIILTEEPIMKCEFCNKVVRINFLFKFFFIY
jgi:hypothetical protein